MATTQVFYKYQVSTQLESLIHQRLEQTEALQRVHADLTQFYQALHTCNLRLATRYITSLTRWYSEDFLHISTEIALTRKMLPQTDQLLAFEQHHFIWQQTGDCLWQCLIQAWSCLLHHQHHLSLNEPTNSTLLSTEDLLYMSQNFHILMDSIEYTGIQLSTGSDDVYIILQRNSL